MQTNLADFIKDTPAGHEADAILRTCTHCGFCLTACPTYQLLGDELDSPRGRIYLIKQMLEGEPVTEKTQLHLDRCLTCRSCETTCPSGVQYGRLVDIGRDVAEQKIPRGLFQLLQRKMLRTVLSRRVVFGALVKLGRLVGPLLPAAKSLLPVAKSEKYRTTLWPGKQHARTMLILDGCVQPALQPNINAAAIRLLDKLKITLVRAEQAGCCGAISYHLNAQAEGLDFMRRNIDAWLPHLDRGAEAIVMTASGCGVTVKEYGYLLKHDPVYADKAARISAATKDISEIILGEKAALIKLLDKPDTIYKVQKLAYHAPCTLQHGQKITGVIEAMLTTVDFELTPVSDQHLCCGSAGTYSILQKDISQQLLKNKVSALESGAPDCIVTANIGCLTHLQSGSDLPVRHWIELLDERLA